MEVQQGNDEIEHGVEEEVFDTVVNCQIKLKPNSDEILKPILSDNSQSASDINLPSLTNLFAEQTSNIVSEEQPVILRAKDSTIINVKKQLNKSSSQSIRHLMQINFKLPPKQEAMIMEMSTVRPLKEMRNLEDDNNEDEGIELVKGSSCTSQIKSISSTSNESKSVRFQEKNAANKLSDGEPIRQFPQILPPIAPAPNSTVKQRALELHSYRIAVESKRLEFLQVKIDRERQALKHDQIKLAELHDSQFKDLEENDFLII